MSDNEERESEIELGALSVPDKKLQSISEPEKIGALSLPENSSIDESALSLIQFQLQRLQEEAALINELSLHMENITANLAGATTDQLVVLIQQLQAMQEQPDAAIPLEPEHSSD
jgi:hypothetical protein